jgi:Zn-dependent protease
MSIVQRHFKVIVGVDLLLLLLAAFISGRPVAVVATVLLGFFLAIVIHELGHAFVGSLYGMSLTGIAIGPLDLNFEAGRVRVAQSRRGHLGGATIFEPSNKLPADAVVAWRRTILGGSLANFAISAMLLWLAFTLFSGDAEAEWKLVGFALISGFIGLANLIPISAGLHSTDGAKYLRMKNGGPAAENEIRAQRLARWCASSVRPREWPAELVPVADYLLAAPGGDDQVQPKVVAACFTYFYLADRGKLKEALQVIESVLATSGETEEPDRSEQIDTLLAIQARHYALWKKDPARGFAIMSQMQKQSRILTHSECQMTIALIKLSEGDLVGAKHVVALARRGLAPMIGRSGITRMETEWLDLVEQRIFNPGARLVVPVVPESEPIIRMIHPPSHNGLSERIAAIAGSPLVAAATASEMRRLSPQLLEPEPHSALRPSWAEAAFAVKQSGGAHFSQLAAEYGAARSWLYRAPGIPVEKESGPEETCDARLLPGAKLPKGGPALNLRSQLKTGSTKAFHGLRARLFSPIDWACRFSAGVYARVRGEAA